MAREIDGTHDAGLESWVESANDAGTGFPIQNLPLALMRDARGRAAAVTRIGDALLNVTACAEAGLLDVDEGTREALSLRATGALNDLLRAEEARPGRVAGLRRALSALLRAGSGEESRARELLVPDADGVALEVPVVVRDYTDFYASVHHATNVGSMFRPDNPLLPNYKWIPVGYHGRASSVVASGAEVVRPVGQQAPSEEGGAPGFGPCKLLDYELEVGIVVGRGNALGEAVGIGEAEEHILGLCLLNDWSARDLQKWEYQPLGPFLAKSFASTVSPYIVTMEALAPFRSPRLERPAGDPMPLAHLESDADRSRGAVDLTLEVYLRTARMREEGAEAQRLSVGNFKDMYWTAAQMLTHHTSNGCNLSAGDLLGSGTVSGPARSARGCLLELTWDGDPWGDPPVKASGAERTPIELGSGETRTFLQDGDEVILRGYCEREGFRRIGLGECRGVVAPARV